MSQKKITYHIFKFYTGEDISYDEFDFNNFVEFVNNLDDESKKYNINRTKFCSIEFINQLEQRDCNGRLKCFFGCIKSAPFGVNKPLLDYSDNTERDNPKNLTEGEKEQNYFILAFNSNSEFEIIFQKSGLGISINQFKNYIDNLINKYLSYINLEKEFRTEMGDIIIENLNDIIDRIDRIVECKLYIDKQVLGSDFLGLSNRTLSVKKELTISAKAEYNQSIEQFLRDILQNITHNNTISRVWVRGKDNNNNEAKFFIEKIMKGNTISVDINPTTGAVVRESIKQAMINLI
ncbi:hypothetical protein HMPREF1321_1570 [Capnocytophaga sp. oral taxon 412 str. F0487]|jgi:hypothetical protein|uniref:hypothetical protein n=1 Tax=Capnocytophaga sp. oral taxon 412 TaxID=712218 RepID=UPI00026971AD|nr:hypothetical protein [Capnocytophaga sp. oral taxon 412]EIW92378.1 hypothetical protein HMPREF1321_1570 [Capnocytophaga sp. oral taxon 412 str. F0487]